MRLNSIIIACGFASSWSLIGKYTTIVRMNSTLIIIRGVPGSGKSYIASLLASALGQDQVVLLDPDAIDYDSQAYQDYSSDLSAQAIEEKFHPFRFLRQTGYNGILAHKYVIWNQAFNDFDGFELTIKRMQEFADQHNEPLRVLVVEVEIDKDTARSRIASRVANGGHDVPLEKLTQFIENYTSFAGRGYETITIDGAGDVNESVRHIIHKLS